MCFSTTFSMTFFTTAALKGFFTFRQTQSPSSLPLTVAIKNCATRTSWSSFCQRHCWMCWCQMLLPHHVEKALDSYHPLPIAARCCVQTPATYELTDWQLRDSQGLNHLHICLLQVFVQTARIKGLATATSRGGGWNLWGEWCGGVALVTHEEVRDWGDGRSFRFPMRGKPVSILIPVASSCKI